MTALIFLLAVVALSLLGGLLLWMRERGPRSMEAHMRAFARQREALAPENGRIARRRSTAEPGTKDRRPG